MMEWSCWNQHTPVPDISWVLQMLDYRRPARLSLPWNIKGDACKDYDQKVSRKVKVDLPTMRGEDPSLSFFLVDIPRMAWLFAAVT